MADTQQDLVSVHLGQAAGSKLETTAQSKALAQTELTVLPGSLTASPLIAPKHVASQLHLPGNLGAKSAGATKRGSSLPATCLGTFGRNAERRHYGTESSIHMQEGFI